MSSSSSSSSSPPSSAWIQQQQSTSSFSNKRTMIEPLNLWPSTSTWAAYSSALASITLGQLNGEARNTPKYSSRNSPLTPTTPTYSPVFSPTSSANSFGVPQQHLEQLQQQQASVQNGPNSPVSRGVTPLSPHSVVDGYTDVPTSFPLDFVYANSMAMINGSKRPLSAEALHSQQSQQQKRSKSFTIDAILGLDEFVVSCHESATKQQPRYCSTAELESYVTIESPSDHKKRCLSSSESSESSPQTTTSITAASTATLSTSSSPRTKRVRTIFSAEQLEKLELEFSRQQYMVGPERLSLAASLRLSESQVKVWFQNRRIKYRKTHLEQNQLRLVNWRQQEDQHSQQQQHLHHYVSNISEAEDEHSESYSD